MAINNLTYSRERGAHSRVSSAARHERSWDQIGRGVWTMFWGEGRCWTWANPTFTSTGSQTMPDLPSIYDSLQLDP